MIDPLFEQHQAEERERDEERERQRQQNRKLRTWQPKRKADTSDWVRVDVDQFERLRAVGSKQLMHIAVSVARVIVHRLRWS